MQAFTVGATDLKALLAALRSLGLDADALAKSVELPPNALDDTSARFPEATMLRLWLAAESSFGKAGLGVHAGSSISFGELELLDYLVGSNATVGDGFRAMARYAALGDTGLTYVIDDGGTGDVTISMQHPYAFQILPASLVEYFWTIIVTRFRLYAGGDFTPSLDLSHARTGPLALYQKVLGGCASTPSAHCSAYRATNGTEKAKTARLDSARSSSGTRAICSNASSTLRPSIPSAARSSNRSAEARSASRRSRRGCR
jgi:hypothetical protein